MIDYAIDTFGYPLGFKVRDAESSSKITLNQLGREVIQVEACHLTGHQREAIVTDGSGAAWRLTSDEGLHLRGTDLAPFPFGFFNAGLQADLLNRIQFFANLYQLTLINLKISLANEYWLLGSFVDGTGKGVANPSEFLVEIESIHTDQEIQMLINTAVQASPAIALLQKELHSTFSLTINGKRRMLSELIDPMVEVPIDPFLIYQKPLHPLDNKTDRQPILSKLDLRESGEVAIAPPGSASKIIRNIKGNSAFIHPNGITKTESWLALPGMSHFLFYSDEGGSSQAPSGLGLLSAGIAFCFITQIARYIENMKLNVDAVRLVQNIPFSLLEDVGKDTRLGDAEPVETHLFLNGSLSEEMFEKLLTMSARTCYLHASARNKLTPIIHLKHNQ